MSGSRKSRAAGRRFLVSLFVRDVGDGRGSRDEGNLKLEPRLGGGYVVEQLFAVLTHERLLVVAADVVPRDPVAVHVVQHAQTRLGRAVDVELGVVRLRHLLVAALAPRAVRPAGRRLVGGRYLAARGRPEPAVQLLRLQVRTVLAALEVAQPPAGPYVRCVVCKRPGGTTVLLHGYAYTSIYVYVYIVTAMYLSLKKPAEFCR